MAAQFLFGKRLLDQQEVEVVEPLEMARVGQGVRGVRVDLEEYVVAEPLADGANRLDVPAWFDLQFDAQVSGVEEPALPPLAAHRSNS